MLKEQTIAGLLSTFLKNMFISFLLNVFSFGTMKPLQSWQLPLEAHKGSRYFQGVLEQLQASHPFCPLRVEKW
jgi:hypothetical protein